MAVNPWSEQGPWAGTNTGWMSPGKGGMQNWGGGAPGVAGLSATNPIVRMVMADLVRRGLLPPNAINQVVGQPAYGSPGTATNAGLLAALLRLAPSMSPGQLTQIIQTMMTPPANRVNPAQVGMLPNLATWQGQTFGGPGSTTTGTGGAGGTTAGGGGGGGQGGQGGANIGPGPGIGGRLNAQGLLPGQGVVQGLGPDIIPGIGPVSGPMAGQGIPGPFGGGYTGAEKAAAQVAPSGGGYTGAERAGGAAEQAGGPSGQTDTGQTDLGGDRPGGTEGQFGGP